MPMHIETCSNCFDLNNTVALRTGVGEENIDVFKLSHKGDIALRIEI